CGEERVAAQCDVDVVVDAASPFEDVPLRVNGPNCAGGEHRTENHRCETCPSRVPALHVASRTTHGVAEAKFTPSPVIPSESDGSAVQVGGNCRSLALLGMTPVLPPAHAEGVMTESWLRITHANSRGVAALWRRLLDDHHAAAPFCLVELE